MNTTSNDGNHPERGLRGDPIVNRTTDGETSEKDSSSVIPSETTPAPYQPQRIQRKRSKGWKMPEGAVYVGRPTKWGNPFEVVDVLEAFCGDEREARADCVRSYREALIRGDRAYIALASAVDARRELRGKDLACWCRLDQPCHADVLLELANS